MVRSKLCALTCTTRRRPIPDRGPSRLDGRVKPRRELRCRRSLIYKLPVLRWSGATARYSRLYVPVETSTPPRRRSKLLSLASPYTAKPAHCAAPPLRTNPFRWALSGLGKRYDHPLMGKGRKLKTTTIALHIFSPAGGGREYFIRRGGCPAGVKTMGNQIFSGAG